MKDTHTPRTCCYGCGDDVCPEPLTGSQNQLYCQFHAKLRKKENTLGCYTKEERAQNMAAWRALNSEKNKQQNRLYQQRYRERQRLMRIGQLPQPLRHSETFAVEGGQI